MAERRDPWLPTLPWGPGDQAQRVDLTLHSPGPVLQAGVAWEGVQQVLTWGLIFLFEERQMGKMKDSNEAEVLKEGLAQAWAAELGVVPGVGGSRQPHFPGARSGMCCQQPWMEQELGAIEPLRNACLFLLICYWLR